MVQVIDNTITANFLTDAVVERHNFSQLNKTRIRFRIQLKKSTKSAAPKWADVLKAETQKGYRTPTISQTNLKALELKMSHFSTVKTKLANREYLVQALQDLKLNPQVHETAQSLKGWEQRDFVRLGEKGAMPTAGYAYAKTCISV